MTPNERGNMKQLLATLTLAALLTACGTSNPFQPTPTGTLTINFTPTDAQTETHVWGANFERIGIFEGDFTTTAPAGTIRISTTANGYDKYAQDITLAAGENHVIEAQLVESLRASYSWPTVTRYETAAITLSGFIVANYSGTVQLRASCTEDTYESLTTGLRGQVTVTAGQPVTAYLRHSSGFSYFTNQTVRCAMYVSAPGRDEARIYQR